MDALFVPIFGPAAIAATDATARLDRGVEAWRTADYPTARATLRPLAERGSAVAETLMGVMAAHGQGARRDPATAVAWWLRAANRGYAPAQFALARAMAAGDGVAVDPEAAWLWATLASRAGDVAPQAQVLADRLAAGFTPEQRAALDTRRRNWRPWPAR